MNIINEKKESDPKTYAIIGAAIEVHNIIDPGHLEAVYHECLEIEFRLRNIPYISKPQLEIFYKDTKLKKYYIPDFIVFNEVVVEIKSEKNLTKEDEAHSCKSRFCSSCGKIATDRWTDERLSDILPVCYHHLVFTLPWQLRSICLINRKVMFQLLFKAVNISITSWTKEYGKYIPGLYIVLHFTGNDPLVCDNCHCEMDLIYTCFKPDKDVLSKFCLEEFQRIPIKQFKIV